MKSLLDNIDAGDEINEALQNISDETIDKVFAGKVALTTTIDREKWPKSYFETHKSLSLGRIYHH